MDLVSRKSLEKKMVPLIAELFKENTTVEIARCLLQVLAYEPAVRDAAIREGSTAGAEKSKEGDSV